MTRLLLLDGVNAAPGRAGESPLEGQPALAPFKRVSTLANLIGVSKEQTNKKNPKPSTEKETSQGDVLIL